MTWEDGDDGPESFFIFSVYAKLPLAVLRECPSGDVPIAARDVDVGIVVHLVALSQVLDDVEVVASRLGDAVLQKPAFWLRVVVS